MNSETLERREQIRALCVSWMADPEPQRPGHKTCVSTIPAAPDDVLWLLAEVARLEQERDEARNERDARRERKLLVETLGAELAAARAREQRATDLLAREKFLRDRADNGEDVIEAITQWDADELLTAVYEEYEKRARAALAAEPAATLAEPDQAASTGTRAEEVPHDGRARARGADSLPGSASAAADEPGERE